MTPSGKLHPGVVGIGAFAIIGDGACAIIGDGTNNLAIGELAFAITVFGVETIKGTSKPAFEGVGGVRGGGTDIRLAGCGVLGGGMP